LTTRSKNYVKPTPFQQADKILRQMRREQAVKDISKSNKRLGIVTTTTTPPSTPKKTSAAKSRGKK
jgi:hypothetical protein